MLNSLESADKHVIDAVSIGAMLGALTEFLPHMAAVFTIVWTGIRIYETETVQRVLGKEPYKDTDDKE